MAIEIYRGSKKLKGKILSIFFALVLVLSLSLVTAVASADEDPPNTVLSSTMWFEGTLTSDGAGGYNGTLEMVNECDLSIGDKIAGFDVYARNGVKATYDKAGSGKDYACGVVTDHDAYTTAGGWGSFYNPDVSDWYKYQLRLQDGSWYVEYHDSGAVAAPMSGTVDWTADYALETGAGIYYSGMGTAESSGYALNNECTGVNDGTAAWDMDWSWGSEYIPLQYPGFDVTVSGLGDGEYRVKLTPAAAGSTQLTVDVPDITAISVDPTSIDFGSLVPGQTSSTYNIVVTNVGTHTCKVKADVSGTTLFTSYLQLRHSSGSPGWTATNPWDDIITGLAMYNSQTVQTRLPVPSTYTPSGEETATLTLTATGT